MKKMSGFTAIEMMIVVTVIMVLATTVIGAVFNTNGATEERAYVAADNFISQNNIADVRRKTCAHDSDGDGYSSCTIVTEQEHIYLQCPSGFFTTAKSCKEMPPIALPKMGALR